MALQEKAVQRHGGACGVLDLNALAASLAQPQSMVFGHERYADPIEKAAAYCYFIACNHPFLDGNKRTGFLAALHFLRKNGLTPFFDDVALGDAIISAAAGEIGIDEFALRFGNATRLQDE